MLKSDPSIPKLAWFDFLSFTTISCIASMRVAWVHSSTHCHPDSFHACLTTWSPLPVPEGSKATSQMARTWPLPADSRRILVGTDFVCIRHRVALHDGPLGYQNIRCLWTRQNTTLVHAADVKDLLLTLFLPANSLVLRDIFLIPPNPTYSYKQFCTVKKRSVGKKRSMRKLAWTPLRLDP